MAKKSLICALAIIVLSLCCGFCFAAEDNSSINLGNEIMKSVDKTGDSAQNVVSGNIVNSTRDTVRDGVDNVGNMVKDAGNNMDGNNNDNNNRDNNYDVTRTTTEGTANNNGIGTMTTTTWMWIILVVAAVIIIAAIWYYATQNNS